MSDQVVLVTGGSGFLGANVIKQLQKEGCRVRTTVRDTTNQKKVEHINQLYPEAAHKVEVVQADLLDEESWSKAVEGCTYVHHVASPFPLDKPKHEDEIIKPAVDGTLNVLKACAKAKTVKRVILTSSFVSIFNGKRPAEESYTEVDWIDTEDKSNPVYARSKGLAERAAWKFMEELSDSEKFELAVVNPTLILGPVSNGSAGSSIAVLQKMLRREYPMLPQFCVPAVDVRDVALAHYKCMVSPEAAGHRHIVFGQNIWFKEMADILDKEFRPQGYNVPTRVMPGFLLSIASFFLSELSDNLEYRVPKVVSNNRMTQVLGITATPMDKTLVDMAYTMIEKGFVAKTDKYTGPPTAAQ